MSLTANLVTVLFLLGIAFSFANGRDKVYYLAIHEIMWDYAPSGLNLVTNNKLKDEPVPKIYSDMYIGKVYKKAVYRRYTDNTFTTPVPHDPNLGFMGPTLRAEVGDRIIIHLLNNASRHYSVHPHGVFYTKLNEGALYNDNSTDKADDSVPGNGGRFTYEWEVRPEYGPTDDDARCLTWAYHSHVHSPRDVHSGLIGALLVCKPGTYQEDETRTDVDHEFIAMFFIPHERDSWYFEENLKTIPNWQSVDLNEKYFTKGNKMHVVNSYMYGNTPGYDVCQGDTVSWHILGMGSNRDLHPIEFQGQTVLKQHHRKDSFIVIPATFSTVLMRANNPGRWFLACKLYSHFSEGMIAFLNVDAACRKLDVPLPSDSLDGEIREYFIAAEETMWNYGPSGLNKITNQNLTEPYSDASVFFERGPGRIGGVYKKAVFRAYTDESFTIPAPIIPHLGLLGPVIKAEIGDTIKIIFKNTAANHAYNMEPHGVYFQETYPVPPNGQHTYTWTLPNDVSPSELDANCITYLYTSSVSYIEDTNSGLVGPLIVCKRGTMEEEMLKSHKYIMMSVFDENKSWYFEENLKLFMEDPSSANIKDKGFQRSNLMHSTNGLMFGNFEIDLCTDEKTIVHFFAVGTKVDIHGVNLQGINVRINDVNTGSVEIFAHTSETVTIQPEVSTNRGLVLCRTNDHPVVGMTGLYSARQCNSQTIATTENTGPIRTYYIAAEEVVWDYNKRRLNVNGESVDVRGNHGYIHAHQVPGEFIGSRYKKVLYFEYTDATFTTRKPKPAHLGILGPIIKGEVGDRLHIVFMNNANRPYNMFPWGAIDPAYNEADHAVQPGQREEYFWKIPKSAGPKKAQASCQSFIYLSTVDIAFDPTDGLMGPLLVCAKDKMDNSDVDEEFYLQFHIVDENLSHYLDDNIRTYLGVDPGSFNKNKGSFVESNKMKAINGFLSHVDGLIMKEDDLVRWHFIGWGNEKDYHSIHFHAHTFIHVSDEIHRGDVFDVFPGFLGTVQMRVVAVGDWLLHCHVFDHIDGGMETVYSVIPKEEPSSDNIIEEDEIRDTCEITGGENHQFHDCSNMNIEQIDDLLVNRRKYIEIVHPDGSSGQASVRSITNLDLSQNALTTEAARRLIRYFPNLLELNLNENNLDSIQAVFLKRNKKVHTFRARNNPQLTSVSKFLVGKKKGKQRSFQILDFSHNSQLTPRCLNQIFTSSANFAACFRRG